MPPTWRKPKRHRPDPRAGHAGLGAIDTPDERTIDDLCARLNVAASATVKTLIVRGEDGPMAIVLRGDHELNEIKAGKLPGVAQPLAFATDAEIEAATGASPGSLGPVQAQIPYLVDREAAALADFPCGANITGKHYVGANWGRDAALAPEQIVDARNVVEGDPAPDGQGELKFLRGIEAGHIFQLGDKYSASMSAGVLDQDGRTITPLMGCYGMGVTRLVAAIIEQNHDEQGIVWPEPLAPFAVHVLGLNYHKSVAVRDAADALYATLTDAGVSVLLDDRDERPGVKFADADLIGLPHRVVIGERGLKNGVVEYKRRTGPDGTAPETRELAVEDVPGAIKG